MKKITKILTGAALVAAAVFTVGCEKKSAEAQTIKIGAMYALSGDKAAIGNNIMRGVDFAVDMINAQGGVNDAKSKSFVAILRVTQKLVVLLLNAL